MSFPDRVISGAMHYFRVHPEQWADRLTRLAAMGLNTIEAYVAWNFHAPGPGSYDFSGWRDLPRFVWLAADAGLDVILRPGPYICAEWDFGGLPAWLLRSREAGGPGLSRLRCSDPAYLAEVDAWFDELMPRIVPLLSTSGGPVVAVQVENEYGSYGSDRAYLQYIRDGLVRRGVNVPLFTSDGPGPDTLAFGTLPDVLATVNFDENHERYFAALRELRPDAPLVAMEFWLGWFDHWGEKHHVRAASDAAGMLDEILATGAGVNLYMAHGGTNFGLWSGANWDGGLQPEVLGVSRGYRQVRAGAGRAGAAAATAAPARAAVAPGSCLDAATRHRRVGALLAHAPPDGGRGQRTWPHPVPGQRARSPGRLRPDPRRARRPGDRLRRREPSRHPGPGGRGWRGGAEAEARRAAGSA